MSDKCYYCGLRMFGSTPRSKVLSVLGVAPGSERSRKLIRYSKRTREHLVRKADGGSGLLGNVVLAHLYCNSCRGETPVDNHIEAMKSAVSDGTHPLSGLKTEINKKTGISDG